MTGSIFTVPVQSGSANLWATVAVSLIILGIFILSAWIVCRKMTREKHPVSQLPFILFIAVGLICLVAFGITLATVKGMMLSLLLLYASLSDIKTRSVADCVSVMIFILSFVDFDVARLPSMLIGAVIVFVPQLALAVIRPSRACGGADMKISTAIAFMLGAGRGVFALVVGMLLAVVTMAIYNKVNARNQTEAFPLVPFLSVGAMLAYII